MACGCDTYGHCLVEDLEVPGYLWDSMILEFYFNINYLWFCVSMILFIPASLQFPFQETLFFRQYSFAESLGIQWNSNPERHYFLFQSFSLLALLYSTTEAVAVSPFRLGMFSLLCVSVSLQNRNNLTSGSSCFKKGRCIQIIKLSLSNVESHLDWQLHISLTYIHVFIKHLSDKLLVYFP